VLGLLEELEQEETKEDEDTDTAPDNATAAPHAEQDEPPPSAATNEASMPETTASGNTAGTQQADPANEPAAGEANMISLTWRLFGNADVDRFEDRFIIEQFPLCAPELCPKPHQAWGFKTLFRNIGLYKKLGVHRPKGLRPDLWTRIHWLNGSGRRMPRQMLRSGWRSNSTTYGYGWASLNHYALRSAESFLVKRDRGRVNHVDRDQGLNYWFRMNFNVEEDRSIQRLLPEVRQGMDDLLALPGVAAQHAACIAAHRAKIAELRARPDQAEFFATLTSPRMQRLSRLHGHFGANVYHVGPGCIPDDLVWREHPPDFFFTVPRPAAG